jgi:hypothetical protein
VYRLSKNFVRVVNRYGRNQETLLLLLYYLRNPLGLLRLLPLAIAMFRRGRISMLPKKIKGVGAIRTILRASKEFELPREKEAVPYTEGMVGYGAVGKDQPERTS